MAFEKDLPVLREAGSELPESIKNNGWNPEEGLAAQHLNNMFHKTYEALKELQENAAEKDEVNQQLAQTEENLNQQLSNNVDELLLKGRNLVRNSDFEELPFIQSRNPVYKFTAGITSPQYNDKKSLKIECSSYGTWGDVDSDFAIMLTETMTSNETMLISFWAYPTASNRQLKVRMAFSGEGVTVNLGEANKWQKISFELDLSDLTKQNDYLYFDFLSSYTLYMSDLQIHRKVVTVEDIPVSFNQVNEVLVENPFLVQNSRGSIELMIAKAQTYLDNINKLSYGNLYTAFDSTQDLTNGKHQIDCSSFANLMIQGIPYDKSKYTISENVSSNLFFQNMDAFKWRYANNIAKYAFEKGYSFTPNDDFSNLQAGDILFFSWDSRNSSDLPSELRNNAFMKIDHVCVFLHKKNETLWSTLQFDNGISTVYYEASNSYMNQCVLAARLPFANVDKIYSDENLMLNGDKSASTTSASTIVEYRLNQPLEKGKYYTLVLEGNVLTPNGYFVVLTKNNKTIFSDFGKVGEYEGVTTFRFPYLENEETESIKIAIGAPSGTSESRSGYVNWCSLYQGYVTGKTHYMQSHASSKIKDFPLNNALISDLVASNAPYYKYTTSGNKVLFNLNLPFNSTHTGELVIGSIPSGTVTNTQRIPCNLLNPQNQAINAVLQIAYTGIVTVIPYDQTAEWKLAIANGYVFKD